MRFHGHAKLTKFPFFAKLYALKSVLLLINCVILPKSNKHNRYLIFQERKKLYPFLRPWKALKWQQKAKRWCA